MKKHLRSRVRPLLLRAVIVVLFVLSIAPNAHAKFQLKKMRAGRNANFIAGLYEDLLGRAPSINEVRTQLASLAAGQSRSEVAGLILTSTEARTFRINGLFRKYVGHDADSDALANDLEILQNGGTLNEVRIPILYSQEYYDNKTAGPDDDRTEYAQALFQDLLGRAPTSSELSTVVGFLVYLTRAAVINYILSSDEAKLTLLSEFYQDYLGRSPTTLEEAAALASHQNDPTDQTLEESLLASDEYFEYTAPPFTRGTSLRLYLGSYTPAQQSALTKLKVTIYWGDGRKSRGRLVSTGEGYALFGVHRFKKAGKFAPTITSKLRKRSNTVHLALRIKRKNQAPT